MIPFQGEPELDSDCEIAKEWDLGEGKERKCRVKLDVLSESAVERLLMTPDEEKETIVTAPIRRVPVGSRWGRDEGVTTMLGQRLKIRRRPTKQEEKAAAQGRIENEKIKACKIFSFVRLSTTYSGRQK